MKPTSLNKPLTGHTQYPLLAWTDLDACIAWRKQQPITVRRFLDEAQAVAARLPPHRYVINLCDNPYLFLLAFAAALIRAQTSLLPPNRLKATVLEIAGEYPDSYLLSDAQMNELAASQASLPQVPMALPDEAELTHHFSSIPTIAAEHIAAILFTSGSTGKSIAYPKPWRTLVLGAATNAQASVPHGTRPTIVGTVPAQHSYGLETMVMLSLQGYCAVHSERPFYPQDIQQALMDLPEPRVLVTTPVHLRALTESSLHMPSVAAVWSATAPLSTELATRVEQLFNAPLHEIFGCTETGSCATRRTTRDQTWKLQDSFSLTTDTAAQHAGTLISAPHLPDSAYLQDQIQLIDARHFKLLGRGADLINIAGRRASLGDLNARLLSIDGVVDGIIFLPDGKTGAMDSDTMMRTAALVVAPTLSRAQVMSALRKLIDPAFLPRPLFLVDALPRNEVTKLPRAAVLKLFAELLHAQQ